jgi:hypothetical protein
MQNGVKQRENLSNLLFNFALEYAIKKSPVNSRKTQIELDKSASSLCC